MLRQAFRLNSPERRFRCCLTRCLPPIKLTFFPPWATYTGAVSIGVHWFHAPNHCDGVT